MVDVLDGTVEVDDDVDVVDEVEDEVEVEVEDEDGGGGSGITNKCLSIYMIMAGMCYLLVGSPYQVDQTVEHWSVWLFWRL